MERRKQNLAEVGSGEFLADDIVEAANIAPALEGGTQGAHRLRKISGVGLATPGTSEDASSANHGHSLNFKTNFTQDQRKRFLSVLHELEAIEDPSPVERMTMLLARMSCDDPEQSGEDLVEFLDNGDPLEIHLWRMDHEQDYHAREMLLSVPAYRENALHNSQVRKIAEELGVQYDVPVTDRERAEQHLAREGRMRFLQEFPQLLEKNEQHKIHPRKVGNNVDIRDMSE